MIASGESSGAERESGGSVRQPPHDASDGESEESDREEDFVEIGLGEDEEDNAVIDAMKRLKCKLFRGKNAYRVCFKLAQAVASPQTKSLDEMHAPYFQSLMHDSVLHFLAPHEILALWRVSKYAWGSMQAQQRHYVMLRSVFAYLRISEEAAQNVTASIQGGWNAFCPHLVQLCEHLASVYGDLEPDVVHRTILAEHMCFYFNPISLPLGQLSGHEARNTTRLCFGYSKVIDTPNHVTKYPAPSLEVLKDDSDFGWGDTESLFGSDETTKSKWFDSHHRWMQNNASNAPNMHYRTRLERRLAPVIWVYSAVDEAVDYAMGIGPKRELFVSSFETQSDLLTKTAAESFCTCFENDPTEEGRDVTEVFAGGLIELYSAYPYIDNPNKDRLPTLGVILWCMRRGLEPWTDKSIDWRSLIEQVCQRHSDGFRLWYQSRNGDGLTPVPKVDDSFVEKERQFYMDALTNPVYGPADVNVYTKQQSLHALEIRKK